ERARREVEGAPGVVVRETERGGLARVRRQRREVLDGQLHGEGRLDDLYGHAALDREGRPPGFVAAHDLGQRRLQRGDVEGAAAPDRQRLVVERQLGGELRVQPHLLLRERQRRHGAARARRYGAGSHRVALGEGGLETV